MSTEAKVALGLLSAGLVVALIFLGMCLSRQPKIVFITPTPLPPSPTRTATPLPTPTRTPSLTPSPTPTSVFCTRQPPCTPPTEIAKPQPTVTPSVFEIEICPNEGEVVWHLRNIEGKTHRQSFGGTTNCWISGQVWTDSPTPKRWVFALRPGWRATLSGFRGGIAWFINGEIEAVRANLDQQARALEQRDPSVPTVLLILPEEREKLAPLSLQLEQIP